MSCRLDVFEGRRIDWILRSFFIVGHAGHETFGWKLLGSASIFLDIFRPESNEIYYTMDKTIVLGK